VRAADLQVAPAGPRDGGKRCGVCQTQIAELEPVGRCPRCEALHHAECWNENGGCSSYGCELAQQVVKEPPGLPQTYWGQEEKQCPRCDKSIKVAALRCRFCGAVFEDRAPDAGRSRAPGRKVALAILVGGILPPTAPLTLVAGGLWTLIRGRRVRLKGFERMMVRLGLIAAGMTTVLLGLALFLRGR